MGVIWLLYFIGQSTSHQPINNLPRQPQMDVIIIILNSNGHFACLYHNGPKCSHLFQLYTCTNESSIFNFKQQRFRHRAIELQKRELEFCIKRKVFKDDLHELRDTFMHYIP